MPTLRHPVSGVVVNVSDDTAAVLGWPLNEADPVEGPPPKAGRGSGRDAWADYAHNVVGIQVGDGWTRDDIIAAVEGG
jgi:hypothetical protein